MKIWFEFDDKDLKQDGLDLNKYYLQLLIARTAIESDIIRMSNGDKNRKFGILINKNQERTILISLTDSPSYNLENLDGAFICDYEFKVVE